MKALSCALIFLSFTAYSGEFEASLKNLLEQDPEYQEVYQQNDFQESLYKKATSEFLLPSIDLSTAKIKEKSAQADDVIDYQNTSLNISYSLFNFGSDYKNYKSQKYALESFNQDKISTLIQQEKKLSGFLLSYIAKQKTVLILEEIKDLKLKIQNLSKTRFKSGSLSSEDKLKIDIDLANAESEAIEAKQELLDIKTSLESYNMQESKLSSFPWVAKINDQLIKKLVNYEFNVKENPGLKELKAFELSRQESLSSQKRLHLGQVSIDYSRNLLQFEDENDQYGHSLSLNYTLPLFEKFSRQSQIEKASADSMIASYYYRFQEKKLSSQYSRVREKLKLSYENYKSNFLKFLRANSKEENFL